MKNVLILICFACTLLARAQEYGSDQPVMDSLNNIVNSKDQPDTSIVKAYKEIMEILYYYEPDTLRPLSQKILALINSKDFASLPGREKLIFGKNRANALNNLGVYYSDRGNIEESLTYYFKSLAIYDSIQADEGKGTALNNIALAFEDQGDVTRALDYYNRSLKYREKVGDLRGKAITLYNIAYIYNRENDNDKSIEYFKRSLAIERQLDSEIGIAYCLNSIGEVHIKESMLTLGKKYIDSAMRIRKKQSDDLGQAQCYENYADIHSMYENYDLALLNLKKAVSIREKNGEKRDLCFALFNLGDLYKKMGQLNEAMKYAKRSQKIAEEIQYPSSMRNASLLLSEIYEKRGVYNRALDHFKHATRLSDSLHNAKTKKAAIQREVQYKYERKIAEDSIRYYNKAIINEAQIDKQKAELRAKRNEQYVLFGGLSITVAFGLFAFNRFRVSQKQKNIIEVQRSTAEMQRKVVEKKNTEITDSINYAKRIQEAILPPKETLSENLVDGFVLFRPKDVVSGDFYWLERANGYIFFAAADCTGHGVPGAMVSVVCSNALSKCVLEAGMTDTGEILDKTREMIIEQLNKSGEMVNDGMDISLAAIRESDRKAATAEIQWSGANNALWILRQKTGDLETLKPDKQPVGAHSHAKPFTTHTITIHRGDQIYLFTDGYVDQFGGTHLPQIPEVGKKFKSKRLKEYLLSIKDEDMNTQHDLLSEAFDDWKGTLEQIDDVCVIGVRF
ncbi:MAG: tetratricopeptide repeat protein [Bacteroidota bacterium]